MQSQDGGSDRPQLLADIGLRAMAFPSAGLLLTELGRGPLAAAGDQVARARRRLLRALLRSQVLHAASRQAATFAGALEAAAATAGPAAGAAAPGGSPAAGAEQQQHEGVDSGGAAVLPQEGPVRRAAEAEAAAGAGPSEGFLASEAAVALVGEMLITAYLIVQQGMQLTRPQPPGPDAWPPEARELCEELVAALESSQVLEHAARLLLLLLLLARVRGSCWPGLAQAAQAALNAHLALPNLHQSCSDWGRTAAGRSAAAAEMHDRVHRLLHGRCMQHLTLSLGLATLCAADGGPAHGLPPELLAVVPGETPQGSAAEGCAGAAGAGGSRPRRRALGSMGCLNLKCMIEVLELGREPPPGRRGALALMLRPGWLAVASARALAASGERGRDGGRESRDTDGTAVVSCREGVRGAVAPAPRLLVPEDELLDLAMVALFRTWTSLQQPPLAVPPAGWRAAAADWWRLAAAVAAEAVHYATGPSRAAALAHILFHVWLDVDDALCLPPEPHPVLAAALDGGLLRCLELLLRRAGRAPQGPEAACVRHASGAEDSVFDYMCQLLAYGEPRQAAALVATLHKLLRLADPRVVLLPPWQPEHNSQQCFLQAVLDVLRDSECKRETFFTTDAAAAGGGGPSPAAQQLLRLLSFAACLWLPELSRLARRAVPLYRRHGTVPGGRRSGAHILLITLFDWTRRIAERCLAQASGAGEATRSEEATGGAGAGVAGGGGGGGWLALLLEEVGAVPLLKDALEMVEQAEGTCLKGDDLDFLRGLVAACSAVAAAGRPWAGSEQREPAAAAAPAGPERAGSPPLPAPAASPGTRSASAWGCGGSTPCAAPLPLPWRPELLRAAASRLRLQRSAGAANAAADAERLAAWLEGGCAGSPGLPPPEPPQDVPLASGLTPPAEARRLLATCANPSCASLEGDSEAGLRLLSCAGCGAAGYCCRPCQAAHWRAGHREACARRGRARRGGGDTSVAGYRYELSDE
ncbi:hypothetical protein GPECTOR_68g349 [Gonium pectorale]|uniref:phytol kinase n=1 Tax=Gonium pectorale TaxID=33097 RepID=A0A150G3H0_GONPE|nr:hypothetical protein GPECTOR_68g349 [Gonium pectorale]|eukprot:KXZ44378.1 hypothetical protein GPECTOR_68g349 [Gonium pectorale]